MILKDIGIIAADTTRSCVYIQALIKANLIPNICIFLKNSKKNLPGQHKHDSKFRNIYFNNKANEWSEANINPYLNIFSILKKNNINYKVFDTSNINSKNIFKYIKIRKEKTFIFSSFGGQILKKYFFKLKKNFLHIHGGYLPDYRGSTNNYFGLLNQNLIGYSSIFLKEKIDTGDILKRKKFSIPKNLKYFDHVYDSAGRAKVLILTLKDYLKRKKWIKSRNYTSRGNYYFIIHPVLKTIAINYCKNNEK